MITIWNEGPFALQEGLDSPGVWTDWSPGVLLVLAIFCAWSVLSYLRRRRQH